MEIILIRHAQSKGNEENVVQGHIDTGLSELGYNQAEALSTYFNLGDLDAIYSSDLDRAIQTARPIADKLSLEIKIDPDLREADFGIWEKLTYEEVREKYPQEYNAWHTNYYIRPSWLESFKSHQKRIQKAIKKILSNNSTTNRIAVFTHGGSIKTQLGYFNKLSGEELTQLKTANCSFTLLKFNSTKNYKDGKLMYYNKHVINEISIVK